MFLEQNCPGTGKQKDSVPCPPPAQHLPHPSFFSWHFNTQYTAKHMHTKRGKTPNELSLRRRGSAYRERLSPFLDHKPLDDVGQDLWLHNSLRRLVFTVLGGSAGDGGGRVPVPRGHAGAAGVWWRVNTVPSSLCMGVKAGGSDVPVYQADKDRGTEGGPALPLCAALPTLPHYHTADLSRSPSRAGGMNELSAAKPHGMAPSALVEGGGERESAHNCTRHRCQTVKTCQHLAQFLAGTKRMNSWKGEALDN